MSTPDDAPLEEDDPFAVVRPTRWKTLEEQEIDEDANRMMASPRGLGPVSYTHLTLPTNREV